MGAAPVRQASVECMRVFAMLAVIVIHAHPFPAGGGALGPAELANQLARFAVPFFFVISGYFWAQKITSQPQWAATWPVARRLVKLFVLWSLVYSLPTNLWDAFSHGWSGPLKYVHWQMISAVHDPLGLILRGTKDHLWFLMSLAQCMVLSTWVWRAWGFRALCVVALALWCVALLGKPYASTAWGFASPFDFRNGPFFGLIFFVLGGCFRRWRAENLASAVGGALFVLGACAQVAEVHALHRLTGERYEQDFVMSTLLYGAGASLWVIGRSCVLAHQKWAHWGQHMLGVYLVHVLLLDVFYPVNKAWQGGWLWGVLYPLGVFCLAAWLSVRMSRGRWTRHLLN